MSTTRRRLPPDQRREIIVRAASELFAERGYAATSLADVAAAAGVTRPLIYQHFASKKDLHLTLLAVHRDGLLAALAGAFRQPGSLRDRLPRIADVWLGWVQGHPFAAAMLFRDTTGDPEIEAFHEQMRGTARATLSALIREEPDLRIPEDRLELHAELIRAAIVGLAQWWHRHPETPRAHLVSAITQTLGDGLLDDHSRA